MLIEIKSWISGRVLHTIEADSIKLAVEALVRQSEDLSYADLRYDDLSSADLRYAKLSYANLRSANLRSANIHYADLSYAKLSYANLRYAKLRSANIHYADLSYAKLICANLRSANLRSANIHYADLSYAKLICADLSSADLSSANLSSANLSSADLSSADLSYADLSSANLSYTKIYDLLCLSELSDAIDLAPIIFQEWDNKGFDAVKSRFGLYQVAGEDKALIAMAPRLIGGFCFVLRCREIWWWDWSCPNPDSVPVLWRDPDGPSGQAAM